MFIPQIFCYGVVGTATAVMNSRRRFALAAGAPRIENLGTIAVLAADGDRSTARARASPRPDGECCCSAWARRARSRCTRRRSGGGPRAPASLLVPRPGWRDPRSVWWSGGRCPSLAQAGLVAVQVLTLLVVANRLAGGVVAFQIALNFYYLAIALGATPVALSLLPRLARMHLDGDIAAFRDTLCAASRSGFFITIPAAVGYLVLAMPLARAISFGRMDSPAGDMVAASLGALSWRWWARPRS